MTHCSKVEFASPWSADAKTMVAKELYVNIFHSDITDRVRETVGVGQLQLLF